MSTRGRGNVRECPVEAVSGVCGLRVAPGRVMCQGHWRELSPGLRTEVAVAWGRWHETMDDAEWDRFVDARANALTIAAQFHIPRP